MTVHVHGIGRPWLGANPCAMSTLEQALGGACSCLTLGMQLWLTNPTLGLFGLERCNPNWGELSQERPAVEEK